ncbi:MAG: tetratricopeptide repeat protein [Verrucomicrobia bacterium]|nr:tetratricopeptide repeat protein [Verrucomicrobiota bacterium]
MADLYRWNDDSDIAEAEYREILRIQPDHPGALAGLAALEELKRARALQAERLDIGAMERRLRSNPEDQEARLQLARLLGVDGRYPEAEPLFREYLRRSPEAAPIRRELALALSVQEKYDEAIEQLQKYLEVFPEDVAVKQQLANIFVWKGDTQNAENILQELAVAMPEMIDVHWSLARILQANQKWDEALRHYRLILELDPHYRAPAARIRQIQNHPGYRIMSLERKVQANPRDVELRLELARNYLSLERYFEAMDNVQAALRIAPSDSEALRLEAIARTELNAFRERQLRGLYIRLEEMPDDHDLRLELARTLKATERFVEARREFELYLQARPDDYQAQRDYAQLLSWDTTRRRDALNIYAQLLQRFPDDIELRLRYLQLRIWTDTADQRDREDIVRLRRRLEDRMASHPQDIDNLFNVASLHELQGRYEAAFAIYRRILGIESNNQQAQAAIRAIEAQPEFRIARFRSAIEQNPRSISTRLEFARYAFETGQYFLALSQAEAILSLDRTHAEADWIASTPGIVSSLAAATDQRNAQYLEG